MGPEGRYLDIDDEPFYCIENVDEMDEFFVSLVSATNHWLFISTSGGLTAGRIHAGNALFPYYTEDKVRDSAKCDGPLCRISRIPRRKNPVLGTLRSAL